MKITRISVFQVDVPIKPATISHDRVMSVFDETLVRIETDAGIDGWGDSVPWGSNFVAAFARGVRAGLDELAPLLIGRDPRMVGAINELMDFEMIGQPYVKTALDVACWDILGRSLGTPLYMLLGGMVTPRPEVVGSIPPEPGEALEASYSEIACAVVAHMGHSTPERCIRSVIYPKGLQKVTVTNAPTITEGRMIAPDEPGIGAVPVLEMIGEPIAVYG